MAKMRNSGTYYELSYLVAPPKNEERVNLFAATGRQVEGIFDFSDGENRKRKTKDSRSASSSHSNTDRVEGGVELANQVPSPWTDGIVSKLSAAQHTKYLEFHARELMGEPVHGSDFRDVYKAVTVEQTKYQKAFQDWAKLRAPQVSFYSQSLQAQLLPQLMTYAELPWTKQFRVMEHINAKMLPNTSQETQRATNVEYKAFIQACCGQAQIIPEEVFNDLVDVPWESLRDQQHVTETKTYPLCSDHCVLALAKHPHISFAATFDGLLSLLSSARADEQANTVVSVSVQNTETAGKCAFIECTYQPPVITTSDTIRAALQSGLRSHLSQHASSVVQIAMATQSQIHYRDLGDREQASVSQAALQRATHNIQSTDGSYLYEIVEIGNLKGVVRIQADMFVGDVQSDALALLSKSLFHDSGQAEESWDEIATVKPVILRPQPDRLGVYGGEHLTQDQCFTAWLASAICPNAVVCSPRLCTSTNRILRVEWTAPESTSGIHAGQLGEVFESCLLQLLSSVISLSSGEYVYVRANDTSTVEVLKEMEGGMALSRLIPQPTTPSPTAQDYPLIPPKWVPKTDQAPYTFPLASKQGKGAKKPKKQRSRT